MLSKVARLFFPPQCYGCGTFLTLKEQAVCEACRHTVHPVMSPRCPTCATPSDDGPDRICVGCRLDPPPFAQARACLIYDGAVQDAIRRSKASGDPTAMFALVDDVSPWFGEVVQRWGDRHWTTPPPHRLDRARRGWDPARATALRAMGPHGIALQQPLRKVRRHPKQARLGREDRRRALDGAFVGRDVSGDWVVFDDVMTTGATLRAISHALLRCGADSVVAVVLARSV